MKLKLKKGLVLSVISAMVLGMGIDASAAPATSEIAQMYDYVNEFRLGNNTWFWSPDDATKLYCRDLATLEYDDSIASVAARRAQELADKHAACNRSMEEADLDSWFNHDSTLNDGYGENIAAGLNSSVGSIFTGWLEEDQPYIGQGHRRNMLGVIYNGDSLGEYTYTTIGIGHVEEDGFHYWVQLFGDTVSWDTSQHISDSSSNGDDDNTSETPGDDDTNKPGDDDTNKPGGNWPEWPDGTPGGNWPEWPDGTPGGNRPGNGSTGTSGSSNSSSSSKSDTTTTKQYAVISGAGSVWTMGSDQPLVITTDGDFSKFFSVAIDGVVIDKSNYDAWSGSTVVSLKPEFMNTLSAGEHTYRVYYTDGQVDTTFRIEGAASSSEATSSEASNTAATGNKAPQTGDTTTVMMAMFMMLVSAVGIVLSLKMRKRA